MRADLNLTDRQRQPAPLPASVSAREHGARSVLRSQRPSPPYLQLVRLILLVLFQLFLSLSSFFFRLSAFVRAVD